MIYDFTEIGVRASLYALGQTANEVATNLSALGYRGARADCDDCPLVHYLKALFPQAHTIRVSDQGVHLFYGWDAAAVDLDVSHTPATQAFLKRFDNESTRDYPELERETFYVA